MGGLNEALLTLSSVGCVPADDRLGIHQAAYAERAGKKHETPATVVFHVRDGKMSEIWIMFSDLYAEDELWV